MRVTFAPGLRLGAAAPRRLLAAVFAGLFFAAPVSFARVPDGAIVAVDATLAPAPASAPQAAAAGRLPIPPGLVALTQSAGQERLLGSRAKQSYWPLAAQFETQKNQAYCSVATSVMALNALNIPRPESSLYPDFPYFTQDDFFRSVDPSVTTAQKVATNGMTLDELAAALGGFPITIRKYRASDLTLDQFRRLIRATASHGDQFVLLNFKRSVIGEEGGGHWSPIAAFDDGSDSALLLDVARYKYPPVWVPVRKLYQAALAVDSDSGLARGLLIVGKR